MIPALVLFLAWQPAATHCSQCATWNKSQRPFRIYGNTYYVGPHGLSSVLITSDTGHVLIDGALPESAPLIVANIRSLGFRIEDVKLIVNSHVHFDHAGGITELQRLSHARVAASQWTAEVMRKGGVGHGDPQAGIIQPITPVAHVETLQDGQPLHAGGVDITPHLTPGHTPGGTSWTWKSCEGDRCLNMVYADSVTPISSDGFKFSQSRVYPNALRDFEQSFSFFSSTPCDILITAHPEISGLWDRLEKRNSTPDAMIVPNACRDLADHGREQLQKRIAAERAKP